MANRAAFKQVDLTRALKAVKAGGLEVGSVEIEPFSGKIVIVSLQSKPATGNALDEWLKTNES